MFRYEVDDEVSLALVHESFAAHYAQLVTEQLPYLTQWLAWPAHCQTEQDFRLFIQRSLHDYADGKSMTCAILYNGDIIGNCSFNSINHDTKCVEVGYWVSQHHQGKGIATRVVQALTHIAFDQYQMEKVQLSAAVDNHASRAVATRCGMTLEGILSHQENIDGRLLSHAIYGLLKKP